MRALPVDPCMDVDSAEEELHASLRRGGWADLRLFWTATLLARAVVWINHCRAAGVNCPYELRVMAMLRREISARKDEILVDADLARHPLAGWELVELEHPRRPIGGIPDWMLTPPIGWRLEDTP